MHPLDGPRVRIARAESEIDRLKDVEQSFRDSSNYRAVKAEFNPKTGMDVFRIEIDGPAPNLMWGVWIGEIAHNLRSALDGLIHQLVIADGGSPTLISQFPIFLAGTTIRTRKNRKGKPILIHHFAGHERGDGQPMIEGLSEKHKRIVESFQPYKRWRRGTALPIYWLKKINNADKHRLIQVVGAKTGMPPVVGFWSDDGEYPFRIPPGKLLKHGGKFGEVPRHMHVRPQIVPLIAFSDGCPPVAGKAVVNTLRNILEHVSEIIESFENEFN